MLYVSLVSFLALAAQLIIFGFLWRSAAGALKDRPLGKAMAFIF